MATAAHLRIVDSDGPAAPSVQEGAVGLVVDEAFVQDHAAYVRRLVCRMGVPTSDVDDAVQEVFLAALRRAATFEPGRSPRPWLFGIARHCARKIYRGAREVSAGEPPEPSVAPEQETVLEGKRARSMVHQALDELPEAQRDVVILHKLEGWPMPSVAEAVGCSVATAQSRYRLGRIHIERIIRGRVVRARFAAAVAMAVAFLGWNAPTAAAAAVVMCLVGGGLLLSQPRPGPAPSPTAPTHAAAPRVPSNALPRSSETGGDTERLATDLAATPAAGESAADTTNDALHTPRRRAASPEGYAHAAPVPALNEPVVTAPAQPISAEAPNPASAVPSPVLLTEQAPADSATLEAWAEEGRRLRHARQLVASDPSAARAVLREYRRRFPSGRMAREAARLAETLEM